MKSVFIYLKKVKDLLPYFLLVAIYFFFVNLEASKDNSINKTINDNVEIPVDKSIANQNQVRIKIPVIPYEK